MIDAILTSVKGHWRELFPDAPVPQSFQYLLQSRRRVVLFLFDRSSGENPAAVVKITRDRRDNAVLEREVCGLAAVRGRLADRKILATLPRSILLDSIAGLSASLETCVAGKPMTPRPRFRADVRHHAQNFAAWRAWLVPFQAALLSGKVPIHDGVPPSCGPSADPLERLAQRLDGTAMPIGQRFGDAHFSNILLQRGRVSGVVDWEGSAANQWVINDWLHFAFLYLVELESVFRPRVQRTLLAREALSALVRPPTSTLDTVVQAETRRYLAEWNLAAELLPAYVAAFAQQLYWEEGKEQLLDELCRTIASGGWGSGLK